MWMVPRLTRAPGTMSFIRLKHLSRVDLPHPEGPMKAVTSLLGVARLTLLSAGSLP